MKTQKLLSLDSEIVEKLREEPNASALVNRLLEDHYKTSLSNNMSLEEKKALLAKLKAKKALMDKIKELDNE